MAIEDPSGPIKNKSVETPRTAICFITDASYCLPAFVAAEQARRWSSGSRADVYVFAIGFSQTLLAQAIPLLSVAGIRLVPVEHRTGLTDLLAARLMLHHWLPAGYTDLLYLDSDIQVMSSLEPLLALPIPSGALRAALDPMAFWVRHGGSRGNAVAARMRAAGIAHDHCPHYINSGVLRMRLEGWDAMAKAALAHAASHPAPLQFHDQDALNAACASRILPLSLAWNFPAFMCNAGLQGEIQPSIMHFMAQPKPWHGPFPPWTARETQPYRDMAARFRAQGANLPAMSALRRARFAVQQRVKRTVEAQLWRRGALRDAVLESEAGLRLPAMAIA